MASVTGMTAEAINEELDRMIVSISVNETTGEMFAHPRDGDPISAGPAIPATAAIEAAWPVGSIYINSGTSTNPATLIGIGTWVRFGKGKTIVSLDEAQTEFDQIEETGGVKAVTLSAAQSGLRVHDHEFSGTTDGNFVIANFDITSAPSNGDSTSTIKRAAGGGENDGLPRRIAASTHTHSFTGTTATSGNAAAEEEHTNLQPYIIAYMWKRTA